MSMSLLGVYEIILMFLLGGGLGFPIGVPPETPDEFISKTAPENYLLYTSWAGIENPNANSTNHTEKLLAEAEIQELAAKLEQLAFKGLSALEEEEPQSKIVTDVIRKWAKELLVSPACIYVENIQPMEDRIDVQGAVVLNAGKKINELKETLEQWQLLLIPQGVKTVELEGISFYQFQPSSQSPVIRWGVKDSYVIIATGENSLENLLKRSKTATPKWLTTLHQHKEIKRISSILSIDLKAALQTGKPFIPPKVQETLNALELQHLTRIDCLAGFSKSEYVTQTNIGIEGNPTGLLSLLDEKSLSVSDLKPIPQDAIVAGAIRLNMQQAMKLMDQTLGKLDEDSQFRLQQSIEGMNAGLRFDLEQDFLASLGDAWCVYLSPSEGGLNFTGLTATVAVKDRKKLETAHEKIKDFLTEMWDDERDPQIKSFTFQDTTIYYLQIPDEDIIVTPSWAITDSHVVFSLFPQNIKTMLSRKKDYQSLATHPALMEQLKSGHSPQVLTFTNTKKLFEIGYPIIQLVTRMACVELQDEGFDVDVTILPSMQSISQHLTPTIGITKRTLSGIECINTQTFPTGGLSTAVVAGMLVPAIDASRFASYRVQSMNNMKNISIAALNHEAVHRHLPGDIVDKNNKPLLSWRVKILPYLEATNLSEKFKLDEPWDSPHNKKFISLMPKVFLAPGSKAGEGKTVYLGIKGENTIFSGDKKISFADIRDGSSNTIMFVEAADSEAVIWTKPDDFEYDAKDPIKGLVGLRRNGFLTAMCDGSVHLIPDKIPAEILLRLFNYNDGKPVNLDQLDDPNTVEGIIEVK